MLSIGGITIETPLALAPMAGVTDLAFRTICREQGAGLTCTEMVSAKALCYQDKKSIPLLKLGEGEHPAAAQIFGSDPVCMEEAAAIAHEVSGADLIDRAPSTAWSLPRLWSRRARRRWPFTAAPRCRCTPAPPTGTISGR